MKSTGAENGSEEETDDTQRRSQNQLVSKLGLELGTPNSQAADGSHELKRGGEKWTAGWDMLGTRYLAQA